MKLHKVHSSKSLNYLKLNINFGIQSSLSQYPFSCVILDNSQEHPRSLCD